MSTETTHEALQAGLTVPEATPRFTDTGKGRLKGLAIVATVGAVGAFGIQGLTGIDIPWVPNIGMDGG